jgi:hypothetical protein
MGKNDVFKEISKNCYKISGFNKKRKIKIKPLSSDLTRSSHKIVRTKKRKPKSVEIKTLIYERGIDSRGRKPAA